MDQVDVERLHFVCSLDELEPGTMRRFDLGATPLVVCRSEQTGEVFALDARCPHQGALLCFGELTGLKVRSGGTNSYVRGGEFIVCPLHRWEFDVRTGYSQRVYPRYHTPTYPVHVEDGKIYVGRPPRPTWSPATRSSM